MTPESLLPAITALASDLSAMTSESQMAEAALQIFAKLLPGRALCIRVLDIRGREPARAYIHGAKLREGVVEEGVTITEAALTRAKLKSAVAASARLAVRERWDSPFTGVASGFAIPLATAGELYGVLDIGYAPGADSRTADEPGVTAPAAQLAHSSRSRCVRCACRATRSACAITRRGCSRARTR
jgi:hypothetical protein